MEGSGEGKGRVGGPCFTTTRDEDLGVDDIEHHDRVSSTTHADRQLVKRLVVDDFIAGCQGGEGCLLQRASRAGRLVLGQDEESIRSAVRTVFSHSHQTQAVVLARPELGLGEVPAMLFEDGAQLLVEPAAANGQAGVEQGDAQDRAVESRQHARRSGEHVFDERLRDLVAFVTGFAHLGDVASPLEHLLALCLTRPVTEREDGGELARLLGVGEARVALAEEQHQLLRRREDTQHEVRPDELDVADERVPDPLACREVEPGDETGELLAIPLARVPDVRTIIRAGSVEEHAFDVGEHTFGILLDQGRDQAEVAQRRRRAIFDQVVEDLAVLDLEEVPGPAAQSTTRLTAVLEDERDQALTGVAVSREESEMVAGLVLRDLGDLVVVLGRDERLDRIDVFRRCLSPAARGRVVEGVVVLGGVGVLVAVVRRHDGASSKGWCGYLRYVTRSSGRDHERRTLFFSRVTWIDPVTFHCRNIVHLL